MLPDLFEATIPQLLHGLNRGLFTSVELVRGYLDRIGEVNDELHAVLELNPNAVGYAEKLDAERKSSETDKLGILHGIPIIVKDNIATLSDNMQTTAGSHAILGNIVPRDAFVVSRLRSQGAIILAKANMSEWSYFRGQFGKIASGWSGRGGQCTNPYLKGADPSGSSSGSGVSAAVGLAAATLGTETDGSIIFPSSICNIVGLKPTVGLVSRNGVIPISEHQDSVGPMCRTVTDAAYILQAIWGSDEQDPYTLSQPKIPRNYLSALRTDALQDVMIGIPRNAMGPDSMTDVEKWPGVMEAFEKAIEVMKSLGAIIIDDANFDRIEEVKGIDPSEIVVLECEIKKTLNQYLSKLVEVPSGVRTMSDILDFNNKHSDLERPKHYEDQSRMESADKAPGYSDPKYQDALKRCSEVGKEFAIDFALRKWNLDALVFPSRSEMVCQMAAISGYPIITVPLGFTSAEAPLAEATPTVMHGPGLPFGLGFCGTAFSEEKLLAYAFAFEQCVTVRETFGGKQKVYSDALPKKHSK